MKRPEMLSIVRRLMRCPAASFFENAVQSEVRKICDEYGLACRKDRYGNLLIKYQNSAKLRPLTLVAHMDHPGFEIVKKLDSRRLRARFLGGVPKEYFRKGTRVRLLPHEIPATLGETFGPSKKREYVISAKEDLVGAPSFAVWELEDFVRRRDQIYGRACDDLIGVATILNVLIHLKRSNSKCRVLGVITRAEEVGFGGALAVSGSRQISRKALVVSLETSRELPSVKMGKGVIIRVGDRSSIFDSAASRFLTEVANERAGTNALFQFQRALMPGGTCEGTVFSERGFQTTGVCVALGNYHNCGPKNRIMEEFVSIDDVVSMTDLLIQAAKRLKEFDSLVGKLPKRLDALNRKHLKRLYKTANSDAHRPMRSSA